MNKWKEMKRHDKDLKEIFVTKEEMINFIFKTSAVMFGLFIIILVGATKVLNEPIGTNLEIYLLGIVVTINTIIIVKILWFLADLRV